MTAVRRYWLVAYGTRLETGLAEIRDLIASEAMSWLGTPYHHRARVKSHGADCATFIDEVMRAAGVWPDVEVPFYPLQWFLHEDRERWLEALGHRGAVEIPPEEKLKGDLLVVRMGRTFSHGAIILDWPQVIHCPLREGVVLADAEREILAGRREHKLFSALSPRRR
jgi:cell wall-associated NlpC family hydrolase